MRSHTVTGGGGITLNVDEVGNPDGQAVLFVHGYSQSRLSWRKQLDSGLTDTFRLVAIDNRGHGLSEKPEDAYADSELWADDIQGVIDTLDLDAPVLVGWSYGGLIISDYLGTYGDEDLRLMLGFNLVVPPHVRESLHSRTVTHDDTLRAIEVPVLITHGEEDTIVLPEAGREHADLIETAEMSLYPETGHSPFWERPDRYNRELRDFVSNL